MSIVLLGCFEILNYTLETDTSVLLYFHGSNEPDLSWIHTRTLIILSCSQDISHTKTHTGECKAHILYQSVNLTVTVTPTSATQAFLCVYVSWIRAQLPPPPPECATLQADVVDSIPETDLFSTKIFPLLLPNLHWTMWTSLTLNDLDRVKWWMREREREGKTERWMMGKDNRALSREDRPSQTVCFCVLQPQATRLDCNNNNADISLAPLFFLTHARTHSHAKSAMKMDGPTR